MLISTILKISALILLQLRRLQRQSRMQDLIYETRNKTKKKWKIIIETLKIKQGLHSPQLSENRCAPKLCFWALSLSNLSGTQVLCIAVDNLYINLACLFVCLSVKISNICLHQNSIVIKFFKILKIREIFSSLF